MRSEFPTKQKRPQETAEKTQKTDAFAFRMNRETKCMFSVRRLDEEEIVKVEADWDNLGRKSFSLPVFNGTVKKVLEGFKSLRGEREIEFPTLPGRQTNRQTYRHTVVDNV
jgi:hypothetical protein